jgi:hypothetical protein
MAIPPARAGGRRDLRAASFVVRRGDGGQRLGEALQRLALGVDAERDLDDPAGDHERLGA